MEGFVYASFWRRGAAVLLDIIIVMVINNLLGVAFVLGGDRVAIIGQVVTSLAGLAYYVYFIGHRGQTVGKIIMKIKVVGIETGKPIGYGSAFLREIVGKILSGLPVGLGYLWSIKDKNKQTWHDKIVKSVVVKI